MAIHYTFVSNAIESRVRFINGVLEIGGTVFNPKIPPDDLEDYPEATQRMYWKMAYGDAKKHPKYKQYKDRKFSELCEKYKDQINLRELLKDETLRLENVENFTEHVLTLAEGLEKFGYTYEGAINKILKLDRFYYKKFTDYDSNAKITINLCQALKSRGYAQAFDIILNIDKDFLKYFTEYNSHVSQFQTMLDNIKTYYPKHDSLSKLQKFDLEKLKVILQYNSNMNKFLDLASILDARKMENVFDKILGLDKEFLNKIVSCYRSEFRQYTTRLRKLPKSSILDTFYADKIKMMLTDDKFVKKIAAFFEKARNNKITWPEELREVHEHYLNIISDNLDNFMLMLLYLKVENIVFQDFILMMGGPSGFVIALKQWEKVQEQLATDKSLEVIANEITNSFDYEAVDYAKFWKPGFLEETTEENSTMPVAAANRVKPG